MRKALLLLAGLLGAVGVLRAQQGNTVTIRFPGVPSGTCAPISYAVNNSNGDFYDCNAGTWLRIGPAAGGTTHNLLSATHPDTTPAAVARGAVITGQGATPTWSLLALGANNNCLTSNGTDVVWAACGAGGSSAWSALTAPTANLSLAHAAFTTTFTWNAATGAGVTLFTETDTLNNSGTGILHRFTTASGSALTPWQADANGNGWLTDTAGLFKRIGSGALAVPGTTHGVVVSQGATSAVTTPATGTSGQVLLSNGAGADPSFGDPVVSQPTASLLNAQVVGNVASGAADSGNPVKTGGVFNTTQPTVTTGQRVDSQSTARGALIVGTGVDVFNVTVNAALPTGANTIGAVTQASGPWTQNLTQLNSVALGSPSAYGTSPGAVNVLGVNAFITNTPTVTANAGTNLNTSALALDASVAGLSLTQGAATAGQKAVLIEGAVTTGAPTYTTGNSNPLSLDTSGNLRTSVNNTVTVTGTVTTTPPANASTNITQWNSVALGSPSAYGTSPGAVNVPGVNAFITNIPAVTQSGTWTVQQGTTPGSNAGAWWVRVGDATNGPVAVKPASTAAVAADPSFVVQLSPNQPNLTTPINMKDAADGPVTPGAVAANSALAGCQFNFTVPSLQNLQQVAIQCDAFGRTVVTDPTVIALLSQMLALTSRPGSNVGGPVRGTFGRPVSSTGDALDVNVKYPPASGDPCQQYAASKRFGSFSTTVTLQIITYSGPGRIYFCSWNEVVGAADNYAVVEGTGSNCATGIAAVGGLSGGITAGGGWNMAANTGHTFGNGSGSLAATSTPGDNVCILVSAASQLSGGFSFVYAP